MHKRRYQSRQSREQQLLLPARVEDYVGEDNTVRAIEAYVETLDLAKMGFTHTESGTPAGQPPYDPAVRLKIYCREIIWEGRRSNPATRQTVLKKF